MEKYTNSNRIDKGVGVMPTEVKIYGIRNVSTTKDFFNLECKACNDTPVYKTSIAKNEKDLYSSKTSALELNKLT